MSDVTYSLTSTLNDRFVRNSFHGTFIYSQIFCQKSAEISLYAITTLQSELWSSFLQKFKVNPKPQFLTRTFHGNFICSQRFWKKSTESKLPLKYFFVLLKMWTTSWYLLAFVQEQVFQLTFVRELAPKEAKGQRDLLKLSPLLCCHI